MNLRKSTMAFLTLAAAWGAMDAAPVSRNLHENWRFRQGRSENWYPATVPGTVHTDLMANEIIEDPFFRLNERGVQWVDKEDWMYETTAMRVSCAAVSLTCATEPGAEASASEYSV